MFFLKQQRQVPLLYCNSTVFLNHTLFFRCLEKHCRAWLRLGSFFSGHPSNACLLEIYNGQMRNISSTLVVTSIASCLMQVNSRAFDIERQGAVPSPVFLL